VRGIHALVQRRHEGDAHVAGTRVEAAHGARQELPGSTVTFSRAKRPRVNSVSAIGVRGHR